MSVRCLRQDVANLTELTLHIPPRVSVYFFFGGTTITRPTEELLRLLAPSKTVVADTSSARTPVFYSPSDFLVFLNIFLNKQKCQKDTT